MVLLVIAVLCAALAVMGYVYIHAQRRQLLASGRTSLRLADSHLEAIKRLLSSLNQDIRLPATLKKERQANRVAWRATYDTLKENSQAQYTTLVTLTARPRLAACQDFEHECDSLLHLLRETHKQYQSAEHSYNQKAKSYSVESLSQTADMIVPQANKLELLLERCAPFFSVDDERMALVEFKEVRASLKDIEKAEAHIAALSKISTEINNLLKYGSRTSHFWWPDHRTLADRLTLESRQDFMANAHARLNDGLGLCHKFVGKNGFAKLDATQISQLAEIDRAVTAFSPSPTVPFSEQQEEVHRLEKRMETWLANVKRVKKSQQSPLRATYDDSRSHGSSRRHGGGSAKSGRGSGAFGYVADSGFGSGDSGGGGGHCGGSGDSGGGFGGGGFDC